MSRPRAPMSWRRAARLAALLAAVLAGCGDDATSPVDAATVDGALPGPTVADIPWLADGAPPIASPALGPCPAAWVSAEESGIEICKPWSDARLTCATGEAQLPGSPTCEPLGGPCPAGDFAEDLPADRPIVYVHEGATGGDGSMASPYGGFGEFGLGGLSGGTVVALSKGRYDVELRLPGARTVWGACAAETELWSSVPHPTDAVVESTGPDVELRRLRVGTSDRPGVLARMPGSSIHLEAVEVSDVVFIGVVIVNGATATAQDLVVRDMRSRDFTRGRGIVVQQGSRFELQRGVIERARENGFFAGTPDTFARLEDVAILDTQHEESTLMDGDAITSTGGATVEVARAALEGNRHLSLSLATGGASIVAEDLWVSDTLPIMTSDGGGIGVGAIGDVSVDLRRATLERGRETGIALADGATATLADVVLRDHLGRESDGQGGYGLHLFGGAVASVERAAVLRSRRGGMSVTDGSQLDLADVLIAGTDADRALGLYGRGLNIGSGATVTGSRVVIDDNQQMGIHVSEAETHAVLEDILVRGTRSSDLGYFGRGLGVFHGATIDVDRALVEDHRDLGVYGWEEGARATLRDIVVRRLVGVDCDGCDAGGIGIGSYLGASVSVERFSVEDSVLCGVTVAREGGLDLTGGLVTRCLIGACVTSPGYDISRLTDDVVYLDNEMNLDSRDLPVPQPVTPDGFES